MTAAVREIVLDPSTGVYLLYPKGVGGFDAEAKDIGKKANGWKNEAVDITRVEPPLHVGDYVILVVGKKRAHGWVDEILSDVDSFGDVEPTPVGITLGLRDAQHRAAVKAHYANTNK